MFIILKAIKSNKFNYLRNELVKKKKTLCAF